MAYTLPILLGITLLTFCLFNLFGGDPALNLAGRHSSAEQIASIRAELGLNLPLYKQYLLYLKQIFTVDFGRSWATQQSIRGMIEDGLSATLCLTAPAFLFSVFVCVLLSLWAAYVRTRVWMDRTLVILCLALMSISSLAYILGLQSTLAFNLGFFPISGWDPSWIGRWQYLYLPWLILFILSLGPNILVYRAVILDEVFQDYVRTAQAKGLAPARIYLLHILKNALLPIITLVVLEMPLLITGAVLIENFFGIPGLGGTMVKALADSDLPVIKAMTVIISILYMFFNWLADILYALADPRIQLQ